MTLAEKYCLTAAFLFLMTGLFTGLWKYLKVNSSPNARAPYYVDIAHRTAFLYAFAAFLLGWFARYSIYPAWINELAVLVNLVFYALAMGGYILHGALNDTANQLKKPHKIGSLHLSGTMMATFMWSLNIAEIAGSLVLGIGALTTIWKG